MLCVVLTGVENTMKTRTKRLKSKRNLFCILSILLNFFPIAFYFAKALMVADTKEKLILGITFFCALILTLLNAIGKLNYRSVMWIIFLGIYQAVSDLMPLILMLACCTIIDEFIISPLHRRYKDLYTINREIDKRE